MTTTVPGTSAAPSPAGSGSGSAGSAPADVVTLRPVRREDVPLLDRWRNDREHEGEYGDFLAMHRRRTVNQERWEVDGLLGEQEGQLLVCRAEEPVGAVQWHGVQYGPNRGSIALNLGIALVPAARGHGIGTRAQRLLADYLFAHTLTQRVQASTDITNLAEQRALERAGFQREGLLRGAQFRLGEWHDMVSYSRLRTDT